MNHAVKSKMPFEFDFTLSQVRPSFVEASLRMTPGRARPRDHLLLSYKNALIAVLQAQFDDRGFQDGMQVRRWQKRSMWVNLQRL